MLLTDDERRMRDGAEGDAVAAAMDLLIRYGDALGAERLVDTRNVAGTMTQPSPAKAQLVREGGWAKAYAVINLDSDECFDLMTEFIAEHPSLWNEDIGKVDE